MRRKKKPTDSDTLAVVASTELSHDEVGNAHADANAGPTLGLASTTGGGGPDDAGTPMQNVPKSGDAPPNAVVPKSGDVPPKAVLPKAVGVAHPTGVPDAVGVSPAKATPPPKSVAVPKSAAAPGNVSGPTAAADAVAKG